MPRARRGTVVLLAIAASVIAGLHAAAIQDSAALGFSFTNIARDAGLDARIVFGGAASNKYLLETTGTGVALIDYDNDGRLDLFFVNGSTLERSPPEPHAHQSSVSKQGGRHVRGRDRQRGPRRERVGAGRVRRRFRQRRQRRSVRHLLGAESPLSQPRQRTIRRRHQEAGLTQRSRRGGIPAAPSSTTIATAGSISSLPTTSISIWRPRRLLHQGSAATRGSRSRAGRPA